MAAAEASPPRKSDLGVRAVSAAVMIAIGGAALWLGGWIFDLFVYAVAAASVYELARLIVRATPSALVRVTALFAAIVYVGFAAWLLVQIDSAAMLLLIIGSVVLVDIGAYAFGRTIGGPKIAPSISPSKTWAGLLGGIVGATLALALYSRWGGHALPELSVLALLQIGTLLAVLAQTGDFVESWLKRRAGVKDSSNLIPGHGGVLDRVDGLLPVAIVIGAIVVFKYPHWMS